MNLADLSAMVRRQWLIAVSCMLTTLAASVAMWFLVPVFYQSDAQLVLLNPAQLDGDGRSLPTNPLVAAGSRSAQVMASTLTTVANGDAFLNDLENSGVTSKVAVSGGPAGGIVLKLSTVATDPDATARDLDTVIRKIEDGLAARQLTSGAPDNQLYRLYQFVARDAPSRLPNDRVRSVALAFGLGTSLTVFALLMADGLRRRPSVEDADAPVLPSTPVDDDLPRRQHADPPRVGTFR